MRDATLSEWMYLGFANMVMLESHWKASGVCPSRFIECDPAGSAALEILAYVSARGANSVEGVDL